MKQQNSKILNMAQGAVFAALCYIGFQFFRFDIALAGGGKTAIHFGNAFCVLSALLLNNPYGILAGAVGMTIADLTSGYATSAPKTFFLKLCIALIVNLVAHRIGHLEEKNTKKDIVVWSLLGSVCGMGFNVFADPIVSYMYKRYLLRVEAELATYLAKITAAATLVNAVTAVIIAVVAYCALKPVLQKAGVLKVASEK